MKIHNRPNKHFHILPNQSNFSDTDNKLNLKERGLLSAILEFATTPNWQINLTHLANECECSVATIQKIIRSLIKKGWLSRERIYSPQGVQGSFCKYEVNLNPMQTNQENLKDKNSKQKIVSEYFEDRNSHPVIQTQKSLGHNNTNSNKTNINNTDINNTLSNKKNVINLKREINSKLEKLIWQDIEEYEDFQNQFLIHKAKMMNKLPGEVEGIFRAMEKRIQSKSPTMSDLNAIKQWRKGFFEETNFIPKAKTQEGFNQFAQEAYNSQDINDFLQTANKIDSNHSQDLVKNSTAPKQKYSLNEPTIELIIKNAISKKEIICERINSDGIRGVQINDFHFEELEYWLQQQQNKEEA